MTGDEGRQVFEAMVPQEEIDRLCREFGVSARPRTLHLGRFVRAMLSSAGTPGGASQAEVLRASRACEGPHVARSACSRWCDAPLARCMAALGERALADARAQQVARSGPRWGVQDWSMVEATTVVVRDALREACPGTGDAAASKVPKVLSVSCGAPVPYQFRPARAPDRRHLTLEESWRGDGLRAVSCQSIAQACALKGTDAHRRWHKIAEWLTQSGRDPNWRRRPSVLDHLRGWTRQPLARKGANGGDVRHRHIKAAA